MNKSVLFFFLGASVTLLSGAGVMLWRETLMENRYAVAVNNAAFWRDALTDNRYAVGVNNSVSWRDALTANRYAVVTDNAAYWRDALTDNRYAVAVNNSAYWRDALSDNRYAITLDQSIDEDAQKAYAAGFILGMAVGKSRSKSTNDKPNTIKWNCGF